MAIQIPLAATAQIPKRYFLSQGFHAGHRANDMVGVAGQPILAAESGIVFTSSWDGAGWGIGGGNVVIIDHFGPSGRRAKTSYAHMSRRAVSTGQHVLRGQVIGWAGTTGNSTGNHLHFAVGESEAGKNPLFYYSYEWLSPERYMRAHSYENGYRGNGDLITSLHLRNTARAKTGCNLRSGPYLSSEIKRRTTTQELTVYLATVTGSSWNGSTAWYKLWHPQVGICYLHSSLGEWVI